MHFWFRTLPNVGNRLKSEQFILLPPSPPGVHCHHETFFGRERSKPELKVGKFVEEDDSASQGESSDRLSVGSMSTAYWRVNSLAIVGAAIALISVFLPWWGIYELVGSSVMLFAHWTLWSPPGSAALRRLGRPDSLSTASISQTFIISSLIVLILALVAASLALAGGLTLVRKYLVAGLVVSILTPIAYTVTIAYVTSSHCLLFPLSVSGPIGTGAVFGTTYTWGFETGFYIFIVGIVIFALSLVLNNSLARTTAIRRAEVSVLTSQPTG